MNPIVRTIEPHQLGPILSSLRTRGRDFGEGLDRYGALLTSRRYREIQAQAIQEIAELISRTSAHQWTRGQGNTQMDLMNAMSATLLEMAEERRNQNVR